MFIKRLGLLGPMNLQLFAADAGVDGAGQEVTDPVPGEEAKTDPQPGDPPKQEPDDELPKTKDELTKLLQSEADKRVSDALKTSKAKWESEYQAKLENEKKEAERLAKLSQTEKEKFLMEKQKDELSKKEKEIALREMKLESAKILSEEGLPISFIDMLTTDNADTTKANIDNFSKAFKDAVSKAVDEKLKSSPKPQSGSATLDGLTKKLEDAKNKAMRTGKLADRAAYAKVKQEIEQAKNKK
jgi:hypothetical protein